MNKITTLSIIGQMIAFHDAVHRESIDSSPLSLEDRYERKNTCPECGKEHYNQNKLSCSAKCYKSLRKRQRSNNNGR